MAGWAQIAPVSFNSGIGNNQSFTAPAANFGYDTGSPGGTFTAWSTNNAVYLPNTGNILLWYYCGATAAGVYDVLVGEPVGSTGTLLPASTVTGTIAASTWGWLGPFNANTYNIVNPANITGLGTIAGTPGALPANSQGCVAVAFTTITTLQVRAYQIIQA